MGKFDDFLDRQAKKGRAREERAKKRRGAKGKPLKKKKRKSKNGWWDDQLGFDGSE